LDTIQYVIGALLALVGGAFSFYFDAVYKERISSKQFWVPNFCRMDSNDCTTIVDTKYGRVIGRPNAEIGGYFLLIYALLLIGVPLQIIPSMIPFFMGLLTILFGLYLIFGLMRLKTLCPICLTVHGLNLIIFILQWV
jgi:uncharacterized membrane protein